MTFRLVEFSGTNGPDVVLAQIELKYDETVISVHMLGVGTTPTLNAEVSNDGVNWVVTSGRLVGTSGAASANLSTVGMRAYMVQARFFRIRSTGGTGAVTGNIAYGQGWTI